MNPVIAASGTFGYGIEFEEIVSLDRLGAIVTKGISLEPMAGHAPPRIVQTAAGMLNAIGLQNVGVEDFIERKLPPMSRHPSCKVIVNVFGHTVNDYIGVIERLNDAEGIAAYELNASCPNVHEGGMTFGADPFLLEEPGGADEESRHTSADCEALAECDFDWAHGARMRGSGRGCGEPGEYVSGDVNRCEERRPRLSNVTGGLSGPAIKPIALRMVYEVARAVEIPILGMGGIVTPEDAVEFHAGRGDGGAGGHGELCRSARDRAAGEGTGIVVQEPRCGEGGKSDWRA